jgi:hypothetical protein
MPSVAWNGTRTNDSRCLTFLSRSLDWVSKQSPERQLSRIRGCQAERIHLRDGIAQNVGVCVQAATKPNRVTFPVSSDTWVVVSKVVVVEIRLLVLVRARRAFVVDAGVFPRRDRQLRR